MLRKSCVVLFVVLLLSSLILGPIAQASVSGTDNSAGGRADMYLTHLSTAARFPITGEAGYTTMILDMSRDSNLQGDPAVMMVYHHDLVHNESYIRGKMVMQRPGEGPRVFPVEWVRVSPDITGDGVVTASFVSDMIYPFDMAAGMVHPPPADGQLTEGEFWFHSVINITGPVISQSMPVPTVNASESSSAYNDEIGEGQTVWHSEDITGSSTTLTVDLKWKNTADNLRLTIYTPDNKVLGPYTDNSDGSSDGRIYLNVTNPDGVAQGTWSFKVTGTNVTGNDSYYLRAW